MIPVPKPDEPRGFDGDVRKPGLEWLANGAQGRPPSYWREALPDLKTAFTNRCGYSAMLDRCGTVDHFVAQAHDPSLLYEWDNLHEVGEGWFEITLPSLQLVATDRVPPDKRALVDATLARLPIRDDERILRLRREWLDAYERGLVTLEGLHEFAPLIAVAVAKRDARSSRRPAKPKPSRRTRKNRKKPATKRAVAKKKR